MSTETPAAPPPSPASPRRGEEADAHDPTLATLPSPFDSGPYARFPAPLGGRGRRRALIAVAIAWIPLAVLAAIEGLAIRPDRRESFLLDASAYARFLIALPLLILAEYVVLPKLGRIVRYIASSGMISVSDEPRFLALVASTRRLLTSPWTAVTIVALAYLSSLGLAREVYAQTESSWAAPIRDGVSAMSLAGRWRLFVSRPLYVMVLALWLWRALLWARFLLKATRLDLRLVASHPDHMGGLRFIAVSTSVFAIVAFAMSTAIAGNIGLEVLFDGRSVMEFKPAIVLDVVLILVLFAGPILTLGGPIRRLRAAGMLRYGGLASNVGDRFERHWLRPDEAVTDDALQAPDFSAVADLYAVAANVDEIKLFPTVVKGAVPLVLAALLPFVPLLLLEMPLRELLKIAVGFVL